MSEKRWLQVTVAILALVPVGAGAAGVLMGPAMLGEAGSASLDSHFRYLSGLLLAIGLAYWSAVPRIETQGPRIGLLTLIVVTGGFCRALGGLITGPPGPAMRFALAMELVATPLVYLWQARVAGLATAATVDVGPGER